MFNLLAKLLGYVMKGCYWLTNNYVLALLLFALAMQILMCPLGIKQQKNMVKQAALRPKEMAIRNKYRGRNDRVTMQKMQNEIMDLYKREGYSQFAGCLPLIVQMLIIFPLYRVVIRPLEFLCGIATEVKVGDKTMNILDSIYTSLGIDAKNSTAQISVITQLKEGGAEAFNKLAPEAQQAILDIGGVENLPSMTLFGVNLGIDPWSALSTAAWFLVLVPVLNLGFMYLSQFLTKKFSYQPPQQDGDNNPTMNSMKMMMYVLPLMTMFITFKFAAAIGIYWIFRTILSIGQSALFRYLMPYPEFTEEDYKKAARDLKGKKGNPKAYKNVNYQELGIRSLHHEDD